eukprot:TRINITY_DN13486_c0_g1_i4.p1 TRINITY_DN13486_c0_g1~~TRINITY_DN13486_c0_g1_i4.p1  ORF type:complete len:332 (+),score=52.21 TRINITY_DN13486_c0_g1_i4:65-1060(+)
MCIRDRKKIHASWGSEAVIEEYNPERKTNLYVLGLPPGVSSEEVKELFGAFGKLDSVNVRPNLSQGYSYAYVAFEEMEDAQKALEQNGKEFTLPKSGNKCKLMIEWYKSKDKREDSKNDNEFYSSTRSGRGGNREFNLRQSYNRPYRGRGGHYSNQYDTKSDELVFVKKGTTQGESQQQFAPKANQYDHRQNFKRSKQPNFPAYVAKESKVEYEEKNSRPTYEPKIIQASQSVQIPQSIDVAKNQKQSEAPQPTTKLEKILAAKQEFQNLAYDMQILILSDLLFEAISQMKLPMCSAKYVNNLIARHSQEDLLEALRTNNLAKFIEQSAQP